MMDGAIFPKFLSLHSTSTASRMSWSSAQVGQGIFEVAVCGTVAASILPTNAFLSHWMAGRLILKGGGVGKVGRIAVLESCRGTGAGKAIILKIKVRLHKLSQISMQILGA